MNQKDILEKAYIEFADSLFKYIYFRVFDREIAKDLTQETFYKVWDYLAKGKEIDNVKAFLYRTAHNLVVNSIRDKKPVVSLDNLEETIGFDAPDTQEIQNQANSLMLKEVLDSFSLFKEDEQEILKLRYIDGLQIQEISSILGISENSLSVKIHRLVQKLKEYHTQYEK